MGLTVMTVRETASRGPLGGVVDCAIQGISMGRSMSICSERLMTIHANV
jgi:hypothetical protein